MDASCPAPLSIERMVGISRWCLSASLLFFLQRDQPTPVAGGHIDYQPSVSMLHLPGC